MAVPEPAVSGEPFRDGPLELQTTGSGSVREGLHAAVVLVAAPVEHARGDPGPLCPAREQLPRAGRLLHRLQAAKLGLDPAHGGDRPALLVVDQLREQPAVRPVNGKAGPLWGPCFLPANAPAARDPACLPL